MLHVLAWQLNPYGAKCLRAVSTRCDRTRVHFRYYNAEVSNRDKDYNVVCCLNVLLYKEIELCGFCNRMVHIKAYKTNRMQYRLYIDCGCENTYFDWYLEHYNGYIHGFSYESDKDGYLLLCRSKDHGVTMMQTFNNAPKFRNMVSRITI